MFVRRYLGMIVELHVAVLAIFGNRTRVYDRGPRLALSALYYSLDILLPGFCCLRALPESRSAVCFTQIAYENGPKLNRRRTTLPTMLVALDAFSYIIFFWSCAFLSCVVDVGL